MKLDFFSQNMEDYFLYRNFLNKKINDGVYIELGAMDGITFSNTLFFEKFLGYKGLLIEPAYNQFSQLKINRKNNFVENYAISNSKGVKKFIGNNACGGLLETMAEKHKNKWHKNAYKYNVNVIPIKELIKKHNIRYIDFFSIDVEGGELEILETMDWNIPVYIICIELDEQNNIKDEKCREILKENNFDFFIRLNNNDFYINKNYFRKDLLYDKNITRNKLTFDNNTNKHHHFTKERDRKRMLGELDFYNKIANFEKNNSL